MTTTANLMTPQLARLNLAEALAEFAHAGQVDRQGAPYIDHVRRVYKACRGLSEDQQIAALLHDVVEDTTISRQTILNLFGRRVHDLVDVLTRYPDWSYKDYIDRITHTPDAIHIKLADLLDNLDESRGPIPGELRQRYIRARNQLQVAIVTGATE
jgi:(p)ppGpp synthase/HD superfamily hydrolase